MRIIRQTKPKHIEGRALDAIERLSPEERVRFANVLRLLGFAGNDRGLIRLANNIAKT